MPAADKLIHTQFVIIGAGFGGVGMGIRLKQSGHEQFVILERGASIGGTWRDNTYPGAACDVQSHLYSYSFAPHSHWSRRFSPQPEIRSYIENCVSKFDIAPHIELNADVVEARYLEEEMRWHVQLADGRVFNCQFLISATGQLNNPKYPDIPGRNDFQGVHFHSARWQHEHDLHGKRVAVIGTGASAIQFVPQIAKQAKEVALFQRSPAWVMPKPDKPFAPWQQWCFQHVPLLNRCYRSIIYLKNECRALAFTRMRFILNLFSYRSIAMAKRDVTDPEKLKKLIPNYQIGCNRILIANDWYSTINQPHVQLHCNGIKKITPTGITDNNGDHYAADVIIYATGFKATEFLAPINIIGSNNQRLSEAWKDGAEAYKGISVSGFPNFFMLYGPNTNLSHNSILVMLEAQFHYVLQCTYYLARNNLTTLDVKAERQQHYVNTLQNKLNNSVWAAGCSSWYTNDAGRNVINWFGFTFTYRFLTSRINAADYKFGRSHREQRSDISRISASIR
ncbi:MAG: NAD(P)/FAD-dependent oxidoreductase [Idiomarina sp.]|nr:NAD(P)/FAD-dependent oxidoreductase [Idiomarina sp.]